MVARDGGIRSDNLLDRSIRLGKMGTNGDVLADGEAKNAPRRGQLESVAENGGC